MTTSHVGPRSLGQLLEAVISLGSDLDLASVLHRIVEVGVELADATYGALGVLDEQRAGLVEFITVGIDDDTRRRIGPPPKGLGLLGAVITDARPLRVANVSEYPRRNGFPPHHPAMTSFLGVPIRIRGKLYGNLYLTDKKDGMGFTDVDEELMVGLASAAGVVIENARIVGELTRREAAISAIQEVAQAVLAGAEPGETLRFVAERARVLANADVATFALPTPDGGSLVLEVSDGELGRGLEGARYPRAGTVSGEVLFTGQTAVIADLSKDPRREQPQVKLGNVGPAIFVAMAAEGKPFGSLFVGRDLGASAFSEPDVDMVRSFAAQAGVVLETARHRQRLNRMSLLEQQERIARDLHDTVIQQIFAVGMSLDGTAQLVEDDLVRDRMTTAVDDLDAVMRRIRAVIFDVQSNAGGSSDGLRRDVVGVAHEVSRVLGFEPTVVFEGAIDALVDGPTATSALATLREALSNVARHARASRVDVEMSIHDHQLRVAITDNGVGFAADANPSNGNGLTNMRARAEQAGGRCDVKLGPGGRGTVVEWVVPLSPD